MPNRLFEEEVPAEFRRTVPKRGNHEPVIEKIGPHWCTRPGGSRRNHGRKMCLDKRCEAHGTRATMLSIPECPYKEEIKVRPRPGRPALRTQPMGASHALGRMYVSALDTA